MLDIQQNADFDKQVSKHGYSTGYPCVVCGRAVNNPKHFVRLFWGYTAVTRAEAAEIIAKEGHGSDLGGYPVGANCLKKHPELLPYVKDAAQVETDAENE